MADSREMSEFDAGPVDPAGEVSSSHEPGSELRATKGPRGSIRWSQGKHMWRRTSRVHLQGSWWCFKYGIWALCNA